MRKYFLVKNIVVLCLFLLCEGSPFVHQYFDCTETFREDNLHVVICISLSRNTLILPRNISKSIQGLYILSYLSEGTLMIEDIDTFQRFPNLVKLQLIMRNGLEISEKLLEPGQLNRLHNELFNLPNLQILGISHVEFNLKGHPWILPESLKVLLVKNSVFEFDLRKCSLVEVLELANNNLNELPTLSNPPPPLKWLNLSRNPLRKLSLNDVAVYCDLRVFGLDQANLNYCECRRVLHWIRTNMKEVEGFVFSGSLECDYVENQDCSEYTLHEAEILKQNCFYHRVWDVIVWSCGIFAISAIMILACFLIAHKLKRMRTSNESGEE